MSFYLSQGDITALYDICQQLATCGKLRGWKKYTSTYRKGMLAFYNPTLGIVLKRPKCILDTKTPLDVRVPTVELGDGWVVQPIVKKVYLRIAVDILRKRMANAYRNGVFPDLHCQNVGWYKGKPVMFDW